MHGLKIKIKQEYLYIYYKSEIAPAQLISKLTDSPL
jgi:hypothetical protein